MPPNTLRPDITVARDGSGNFASLQQAIDSVPKGNTERRIIFIRSGVYNEPIRLDNSFITLLGEDRKKTRIAWEINDPRLRPDQHKDGIGIAVVNLHDCNDIIIDRPAGKGTSSPSSSRRKAEESRHTPSLGERRASHRSRRRNWATLRQTVDGRPAGSPRPALAVAAASGPAREFGEIRRLLPHAVTDCCHTASAYHDGRSASLAQSIRAGRHLA